MNKWRWQEFLPKIFVCFKEGYTLNIFRKDLIAGVTVGIVSLPLAMAFAIASGVSPQQGLYTAVVAGFITALLGGSRVQVAGPTGAFVVVLYDVVQRIGYDGLVFATLIAAILLIIMALCRLGALIKYIPYPLITGFTTGIAVVLFSAQVKDFFGLAIEKMPADFIPKWIAIGRAFHTWDLTTTTVAAGTLLLIILIRRYVPKIPWGIASIVVTTVVCWGAHLEVSTIASKFGEIPRSFPMPSFPQFTFSWDTMHLLIPDAITIAFLAGVESLLCAVIADGMTGGRHKSNCELLAQGIGNLGSICFNGIPSTGAIARTATNIKSGAKTPVAAIINAATILIIILCLAPLVSHIPLAGLSAVLMMIAYNMSELSNFRRLFKAPAGDVAVLLTAFFLTIFIDITVAVEVGVVMAAFLFMRRMSSLSDTIAVTPLFEEKIGEHPERGDPDAISKKEIPENVEVYEVNGPLFFGVADRLKDALYNLEHPPKVFILRMRKVPVIDATGMHALKQLHIKCKSDGTTLILSGVQSSLSASMKKFGVEDLVGSKNVTKNIDAALHRARDLLG